MGIKTITLYKYLPCDENSIKPLSEGELKYTDCRSFNDPFDCSPVMYTDSYNEFKEQMRSRFEEIAQFKKLSPAKKLQEYPKMLRRAQNKLNELNYFQNNIASDFGVLSLSEKYKDTLMWSHYANNHKGYLLKLHVPVSGSQDNSSIVDEAGFNLISFPVKYDTNRPRIKYPLDDTRLAAIFIDAVTIKDPQWEYEKEHRVVDHRRGPGIHMYNRQSSLAGVVFGARTEQVWKSRILKLIENIQPECNNTLTVEQAVLSDNKFEIIIQKQISQKFSN